MIRSATLWLVLAGLAIVAVLALLVVNGLTEPFDDAIIAFVRQPALDAPLSPLAAITQLGSTTAVTVIGVIVFAVLALLGNPRWGIVSGATIGLASLLNTLFKRWIERARPDALDPLVVEHGYSFPSGHAMLSMTAWGIVAVLIHRSDLPLVVRRIGVVACFVLAGLIGLSRVYLGVHYPSDVLAGWTAGAVIVLLYARFTRPLDTPHLAAGRAPRDVSEAPAEPDGEAVDADRAAPRSDPPARR